MVVVMNERATEAQIDSVIQRLIDLGMDVHRSSGVSRTVLGVVGAHKIDPELIGILDGVQNGEEDIFPDPLAQSLADGWRNGAVKAFERQLAQVQ